MELDSSPKFVSDSQKLIADDAVLNLRCDGLSRPVRVTSPNTVNGKGQATFAPIQFNVGIPARTDSTVLVDKKHAARDDHD